MKDLPLCVNFFFFSFFIGVWLLYSVVSVSARYIFNMHISVTSLKLSLLVVSGISYLFSEH